MPLPSHGDLKYHASSLADGAAEWDALRIEHRLVGTGTGMTPGDYRSLYARRTP